MKPEIRVYTLGRLLIQRDGETVESIITAKAMLLFTYLAMHPGEHSRRKLAFMLWSETTDQQALKNLRTVLSSLRQRLEDCLEISNEGLAINPDQVSLVVDASQFEAGCVQLFSAPPTPTVLKSMQDLADLYQGDFLTTITVRDAVDLDDWISEKQRYLSQLYIRLLGEIVEVAEKQGSYELGLHYARRLVKIDPLWDVAQRQLMRLLVYTRRSNEALQHYEAFVELLVTELDSEPEEETTALYEQIRAKEFVIPQVQTRSAIVLPDMPFVEPVDDLTLAERMLNTPPCHLLTIYGISGIGKTSLVTRIAFHCQELYPDGAYFIALRNFRSARDLAYGIAGALGIDVSTPGDEHLLEDAIVDHVRNRCLLLVLDNYENLLPETGLIERLLEEAPHIQIIIASQIPLNLFREWLLPLNGLRVPSSEALEPENYESVRLFELTAQRINPRFDLRENLAGVVRICQLVDGLPLAIAIAAGWTQILPINRIIEHLVVGQELNLPFQQSLPPRHRSLELMLENTWNTLEPSEQVALTSLSILNSAFTLEAADQICGVDIMMLTTLIQRSLIQKFGDRYRMHQLVLRYAHRRLVEIEQKAALARHYELYFTAVLQHYQQQKLSLHEYMLAIERLYPALWHYDWMPDSIQPLYMLAMSRFLIAYWEISRTRTIPQIRQLFEQIAQENLPAETRTLLNLQIARLYVHDKRFEQARDHLRLAMKNDPFSSAWTDLAMVFNFYGFLLHLMKPAQPDAPEKLEEDETYIFHKTQLTLTTLYLDICDYESVEEVYIYLLETTEGTIHRALILAVRGAIAAEQNHTTAAEHFAAALDMLEALDEPLIKHSLNTLLRRIKD